MSFLASRNNSESAIAFEAKKMKIATVFSLVTFGMLFAGLFLGFFVYRLTADTWPPMGMPRAPLLFPLMGLFFAFLSSISIYQYERTLAKSKLSLTIILGLLFFAAQWLLWNELKSQGLSVSSGIFASLLHGLTWIHAAHLVLGLSFLFLVLWKHSQLKHEGPEIRFFREKHRILVKMAGNFWHFLGIVWLLIFLLLFVW